MTRCMSVVASWGVQHRAARAPGCVSWFPIGNPESRRTSHPPLSNPPLDSEPSLYPAPPCASSARAICASVHPGFTSANANSSPGPYRSVVTEKTPSELVASSSGAISSARETSHEAHAGLCKRASGAERPPGHPTSKTRHAGQGAWRARTVGGTPHTFTENVVRAPFGLRQSRLRSGCARDAEVTGSSAVGFCFCVRASFASAEIVDASASARRSARRRTRAARLCSGVIAAKSISESAFASASSRADASRASTKPSVAARAFPCVSTLSVLRSSPRARTSPSDPNKGQLRSASSFVQSMTGSNVSRIGRMSSNGATRLTHSGASESSCRSSASADRASSRANAPRKVDVETPTALAPTVPSAPKPHAPPSVMRASPSPIALETFATSARVASASSAVEATAPSPTRRHSCVRASPRRRRDSASRQSPSTSPPSRTLPLAMVFPNVVGRSEEGGSAPPRISPSSASRSVAAETTPPRSGARSRRAAARPPAIVKRGGVCSHARALPNG